MKNKIKGFIKKIWSNRPFRTFVQGFIGTLAGAYIIDLDINGFKALFISAIMAGIAAVMNLNAREE